MDGDGEAPQHEDVPYVLVYITVCAPPHSPHFSMVMLVLKGVKKG